MQIKGNRTLLEIAFVNPLKNAFMYSNDYQVTIHISSNHNNLTIDIINHGDTLNKEEQANLFRAFMRGANAKGTNGIGLGLRIVKRIFDKHQAVLKYHIPKKNLNVFTIIFAANHF